jgi:GNAT superfamily N-acetyltransferase
VNLANTVFDDVNMAGVRFHNINMSDITVSAVQLGGAHFKDIGLPPGSPGTQRPLTFEDADLTGAVFSHCDLSRVRIEKCRLEGLTVDGILLAEIAAASAKHKTHAPEHGTTEEVNGVKYGADIPSVEDFKSLFDSTGWNDEYLLSPGELHKAITNSWCTVSAYHGANLAGFGRVVSDGVLHAMIYDLIVQPDRQGKGIGNEILRRLLLTCLDAGIRDIQLFCARGKRKFYERRGFRARTEDAPGMEFDRMHPGKMK